MTRPCPTFTDVMGRVKRYVQLHTFTRGEDWFSDED